MEDGDGGWRCWMEMEDGDGERDEGWRWRWRMEMVREMKDVNKKMRGTEISRTGESAIYAAWEVAADSYGVPHMVWQLQLDYLDDCDYFQMKDLRMN